MALPRQIQAQLEEANAALAAANPPPSADPPAPAPPADPAPPVYVAQQPAPPAPAPAMPPAEDWKHKYNVLQGMFNSQNQQFKQLQAQVAELSRAPAPPPPAPTPAPRPVADPQDVEAFGHDMVSMVQRVADQHLRSASQQIEQQFAAIQRAIEQLQQAVSGTSQSVAATSEQLFFAELDKLLPQWRDINKDDAFLAFLAEPDPIYGRPRQEALNDAADQGDAKRAAAIFRAFTNAMPQAQAPAPQESPSPRSAGAAPPPPSTGGKPIYTQAIVAKFYDDRRRGVFRGREAEAQRIDAEFNAAIAEGRVR